MTRERRKRAALPPVQRCHAQSKRTGEQCGKYAMLGARVCYFHGGAAPQVQKKARERLLELVHPAITRLETLIEQADTDSACARACLGVLDRAGLGPKQTVEIDGTLAVDVSARELLADRIARIAERKRTG